MSDILNANMKEKEQVDDKSCVSDLVKNSDLDIKLATLVTKRESKAEENNIGKLATLDLSYFLGKSFFGDDGFQNMFAYQPTFSNLELKEDKCTDYFFTGNQEDHILLNLHHYT